MVSQEVETINELIDQLREGKIDGTIEVVINNKGKVNKILIRKDNEEVESAIKSVKLKRPDLEDADFSGTVLSGSDFSGINLRGANFSYSRIENSDLSGSYLAGAVFYKSRISQTDMSNSYGANTATAYMTGSVNLYNTGAAGNPYNYGQSNGGPGFLGPNEYGEHTMDMGQMDFTPLLKRNY